MYRRARRTTVLLAVLVGVLWSAGPAQASGNRSTGTPALRAASITLQRGTGTDVEGGFLQPGSTYTLSADYGRFANSTKTETEVADQNGRFDTQYYLTGDVAANSVTLNLTGPGSSDVLASLTLTVGAPTGQLVGRVCPGAVRGLSTRGLLDGSYRLSSTAGFFLNNSATASQGSLDLPQLWLPAVPPRQFTIAVTRADSGAVALTDAETVATPEASSSFLDYWDYLATADCFAPNETVQVVPADGFSGPSSVTASAAGTISFNLVAHPASQLSRPIYDGQLFGSQTGQSAGIQHLHGSLPGTTLFAGQSLTAEPVGVQGNQTLVSPSKGYSFQMQFGQPGVVTYLPEERWIWSMVNDEAVGSSLKVLTNGNLVLYGPTGLIRWQSGTAGTGSANRLVMQQNGNLVLSTSTGALVWSKDTGQVRNAQGLVSYAYLASSRVHSAVYINGLVHQKTSTGQLIDSASRTVYLQRYLNGHWQNMLARTTNSNGQLAVGFIQNTAYQYRLQVLRTATASGTASGSTVR